MTTQLLEWRPSQRVDSVNFSSLTFLLIPSHVLQFFFVMLTSRCTLFECVSLKYIFKNMFLSSQKKKKFCCCIKYVNFDCFGCLKCVKSFINQSFYLYHYNRWDAYSLLKIRWALLSVSFIVFSLSNVHFCRKLFQFFTLYIKCICYYS